MIKSSWLATTVILLSSSFLGSPSIAATTANSEYVTQQFHHSPVLEQVNTPKEVKVEYHAGVFDGMKRRIRARRERRIRRRERRRLMRIRIREERRLMRIRIREERRLGRSNVRTNRRLGRIEIRNRRRQSR